MIQQPTTMNDKGQKTQWIEVNNPNQPRSHQAQLYLFNQSYIVQKFDLDKSETIIGSSRTADIRIQDPYVSKTHVLIQNKAGTYFLKDLSSTNGSFINHTRVKDSELKPMSYIRIGKTMLQFVMFPKQKPNIHFHGMVSHNPIMQNLFQSLKKIAEAQTTVLILGETGTGKELVAKAIHKLSSRRRRPLITINCAAIPKELIESELFGHVAGAFTGAERPRQGHFLAANGGTLFLDEIGEMPLDLQPKLLRVLEQRELRPLGSEKIKKVDVRIIAATHRNLSRMVHRGEFREDLFYRLNLIPIHIPPLKTRKDDIPILCKHFLKETELSAKALKMLVNHEWPGNIRELKNVLDRAKILSNGYLITEKEIHQILNRDNHDPFGSTLNHMERDILYEFLERNQWNRSATARSLGIPKSTLFDKMRRYNITAPKKEIRQKKIDSTFNF